MENRTVAENKIIKVGSLAELRGLPDGQEFSVSGVAALGIAREMDDEIFSTLAGEIKAMRAEISELRQKANNFKTLEYRGVFSSGGIYGKNDLVTHDGSLWIASTTTTSPPPGNGWKLCVKRGKDGKSARAER